MTQELGTDLECNYLKLVLQQLQGHYVQGLWAVVEVDKDIAFQGHRFGKLWSQQ